MVDPDEIQRTVAKMQRVIEPVARLQEQTGFVELAEKIRRTYSPLIAAELAKVPRIHRDAVSAAVLSVEQREQFRQIAEKAARAFSRSDVARVSDQIGRVYSSETIHAMAKLAADSMRVADFAVASPADVDVGVAVSRFEAELTADDAPSVSLGERLTALTEVRRVRLFVDGLVVLNGIIAVMEQASGEDIPDGLQAAINLCFAVVAFLLPLIEQQAEDGDD